MQHIGRNLIGRDSPRCVSRPSRGRLSRDAQMAGTPDASPEMPTILPMC